MLYMASSSVLRCRPGEQSRIMRDDGNAVEAILP
jgi:hypothetical protein